MYTHTEFDRIRGVCRELDLKSLSDDQKSPTSDQKSPTSDQKEPNV